MTPGPNQAESTSITDTKNTILNPSNTLIFSDVTSTHIQEFTTPPTTPEKKRENKPDSPNAKLLQDLAKIEVCTPQKKKTKIEALVKGLAEEGVSEDRLQGYREIIRFAIKHRMTDEIESLVTEKNAQPTKKRKSVPRIDALHQVVGISANDFGFMAKYLFPQTQLSELAAHAILEKLFNNPETYTAIVNEHKFKYDLERQNIYKKRPIILLCNKTLQKIKVSDYISEWVSDWNSEDYSFLQYLDEDIVKLVAEFHYGNDSKTKKNLEDKLQHAFCEKDNINPLRVEAVAKLVRAWHIVDNSYASKNIAFIPAVTSSQEGKDELVIFVATSGNPVDADGEHPSNIFHSRLKGFLNERKITLNNSQYTIKYIEKYHEEFNALLNVLNGAVGAPQDQYARPVSDTHYVFTTDNSKPKEPHKSCSEKKIILEFAKLSADGVDISVLGGANIRLPLSPQLDSARIVLVKSKLGKFAPQPEVTISSNQEPKKQPKATNKKSKTQTKITDQDKQTLDELKLICSKKLSDIGVGDDTFRTEESLRCIKNLFLHGFMAYVLDSKQLIKLETVDNHFTKDEISNKLIFRLAVKGEYLLSKDEIEKINSAIIKEHIKSIHNINLLSTLHRALLENYIHSLSLNIGVENITTLKMLIDTCLYTIKLSNHLTAEEKKHFDILNSIQDDHSLKEYFAPERILIQAPIKHSKNETFKFSINGEEKEFTYLPCCHNCEAQNFAYRFVLALMREKKNGPESPKINGNVFGSPPGTNKSTPVLLSSPTKPNSSANREIGQKHKVIPFKANF
ncbi:MAG: hypothetical protein H6586_08925 [Flavobacteriales bacterium]|nr:hypothetical protein [Flavobacteriales bacterium]